MLFRREGRFGGIVHLEGPSTSKQSKSNYSSYSPPSPEEWRESGLRAETLHRRACPGELSRKILGYSVATKVLTSTNFRLKKYCPFGR